MLRCWALVFPHYQLPITNYPLPITHYQLPITNYPLPITSLGDSISIQANMIQIVLLLNNLSRSHQLRLYRKWLLANDNDNRVILSLFPNKSAAKILVHLEQ
ncbi:hypothetical protein [Fischerella thermalis]|uniref:hypothetical protein n=1 Tax=Fischerella thermalis TaxID=372787 RepID=UPI00307F0840